jgi:hypothetical protein
MKRTQLYLDEDLWEVLHIRARESRSTVSELVRQAVRERYLGDSAERKRALLAIVGMWKDRPEFADSEAYVRKLRRDTRFERLSRK